jgi:hypothetical protein
LNTYLILSDITAVLSLENKVAVIKPALVDANALIFGAARLLSRDYSGGINFFKARLDTARGDTAPWIRWYYGFSLILDMRFADAAEQFLILVSVSQDAVLTGLCAYFLAETLNKALPKRGNELLIAAESGKNRALKAFPSSANWNREVERLKGEIYAVIISQYITETGAWLYLDQ